MQRAGDALELARAALIQLDRGRVRRRRASITYIAPAQGSYSRSSRRSWFRGIFRGPAVGLDVYVGRVTAAQRRGLLLGELCGFNRECTAHERWRAALAY